MSKQTDLRDGARSDSHVTALWTVHIWRVEQFEQFKSDIYFLSYRFTNINFCHYIHVASIQDLLEKSWTDFFMDNFDLVLLNHVKQTEVLSILRSFVHINVLKVLWRKHFLKTIYRLRIPINFVVSCVLFLQKQPPELFCKKRRSEKFRKIHEKTPVAGSLF